MHEELPKAEAFRTQAEPWMRNTHLELDSLRRGVLHAIEMTHEDAQHWVRNLSAAQFFATPQGLPSVAFHMRHIARSLDRLLTYAEARPLNTAQLAALATEHDPGDEGVLWDEFTEGLRGAGQRVIATNPSTFEEARGIGRLSLPTTVGGLLLHSAEHTQRHAGQMVTTAKLVRSLWT